MKRPCAVFRSIGGPQKFFSRRSRFVDVGVVETRGSSGVVLNLRSLFFSLPNIFSDLRVSFGVSGRQERLDEDAIGTTSGRTI